MENKELIENGMEMMQSFCSAIQDAGGLTMLDLFKSVAKKMLIDFEDTKNINHNLIKGQAREYSLFNQFLKE